MKDFERENFPRPPALPCQVPNLRKLQDLLHAPLPWTEKLRYLTDRLRGQTGKGYRLAGGGGVKLRPGTTDLKVFDEVYIEQIYRNVIQPAFLAQRNIETGVDTIVDLGANIGLSTVYLLQALPDARAIAVEPDPGNFSLLQENLYLSGTHTRCRTLQTFVGAQSGFAELVDSGNGAWGMRMGGPSTGGTPVLRLEAIAREAGMERISLLKCDIEGSERDLFHTIRDWEHLVDYIVLELHADLFPVDEFLRCLAESGYQWDIHGDISQTSVLSVFGLERAELKRALRGQVAFSA